MGERYSGPLLEPKKYDPLNPFSETIAEEPLSRYQSVAWQNPFSSPNAFRELWQDHSSNSTRPPASPMALLEKATPKYKQVWIQSPREVHPALRQTSHSGSVHTDNYRDRVDRSPTRHAQVEFQDCSPQTFESSPRSPAKTRFGMSKSYSDSTFYSSGASSNLVPPPLYISSSPIKPSFPVIREHEDLITNRKISIKENEDGFQMVNSSPRKQLFGEKGLLGRSYSARSPTTMASPKKAGAGNWGGKIKQRIGEMGREISGKVASLEPAQRRPAHAGNSGIPISLSPGIQADVYMQLELLLTGQVNEFLLNEARHNRVGLASIKTIAEQWRNKGRPQVLGFSYDFKTQRELVSMNIDTLCFATSSSFSRVRALSVLASWKVLAAEMSIRTFCQPDSAVKKHFHDAEAVLEFVGVKPDSMMLFHELKSRVVTEIYLKGKTAFGEEVAWPFAG